MNLVPFKLPRSKPMECKKLTLTGFWRRILFSPLQDFPLAVDLLATVLEKNNEVQCYRLENEE